MWKRIICFLNGHKWGSKERFWSYDGISGVNEYKIVCERCNKGDEKDWQKNTVFRIVS